MNRMSIKIKETLYSVLALIGIIAGCAIVVWGLIEFMWMCYYAGIPM